MESQNLVMTAGGIAFLGSFKTSGGFPTNGYAIIAGTTALTFLAAMASKTPIDPIVKGLAGLMVLACIYAYVPGLTKTVKAKATKKTKDKNNG